MQDGVWLADKLKDLDTRRPPILEEPDYTQYAAASVTVWRYVLWRQTI